VNETVETACTAPVLRCRIAPAADSSAFLVTLSLDAREGGRRVHSRQWHLEFPGTGPDLHSVLSRDWYTACAGEVAPGWPALRRSCGRPARAAG
jgi:hypothetical protein